jgi:hypothetical protein
MLLDLLVRLGRQYRYHGPYTQFGILKENENEDRSSNQKAVVS